jgi:predicted RNA polymerase sigma factor
MATVAVSAVRRSSGRLLLAGALAGPFFFASAISQMLTREAYDIARHPISQLATGSLGWIQISTFVLAGLGCVALAAGVKRTLSAGRAKQQLARAGARFMPPTDADLDSRIAAVMQGLYLIFNEGYTASTGDELARVDLTREAIRLTRMLRGSLPDDAEVTGLLALMLLTEARRDARTGDGELVPMDEQDRTQWNPELIREGTELIDTVWSRRRVGLYQLQAAIAAVHATATSPEQTDWPQIAALYLWLERLTPTAPVRLSRVVAVTKAYGPARGLALLDDLNRRYRLDREPLTRQRERAVRAHLLQMIGDAAGAATLYRQAAALTDDQVEQRYLLGRARGLHAPGRTSH